MMLSAEPPSGSSARHPGSSTEPFLHVSLIRRRGLSSLLMVLLCLISPRASAEIWRYLYDADGFRVGAEALHSADGNREAPSAKNRFLFDPLTPGTFPQIVAQRSAEGSTVAYLHGLAPISECFDDPSEESENLHLLSDGSGSMRVAIPQRMSASTINQSRIENFESFGQKLEGGMASAPASASLLAHSYRGEWFDRAVGLYQLRARWYAPHCGRFITADDFEGHANRPLSQHRFTYAEADPINHADPSGHEALLGVSVATSIGASLHSMYDDGVSSTGFALMDSVRGVQAGMTADAIYQEYLINTTLGIGTGLAIGRGSAALSSFRVSRLVAAEASVTRRLFALLGKSTYWEHAGGIAAGAARELAGSHGFAFEVGRLSRFENARNAVVIGRQDLIGGEVNRIMLAEEIQHGLDRATSEASQAIKRGLDNVEFHAEVFGRILKNYERGHFPFLTPEDLLGLKSIIAGLK